MKLENSDSFVKYLFEKLTLIVTVCYKTMMRIRYSPFSAAGKSERKSSAFSRLFEPTESQPNLF